MAATAAGDASLSPWQKRPAPAPQICAQRSVQPARLKRALSAAGGTPGPCGRTQPSQLLAGVTGQSQGDPSPPSEAAIRLEYRAGPRSSSCSRRWRRAISEARPAKASRTSPARARDRCQAVQKQSGGRGAGAAAGRRVGWHHIPPILAVAVGKIAGLSGLCRPLAALPVPADAHTRLSCWPE